MTPIRARRGQRLSLVEDAGDENNRKRVDVVITASHGFVELFECVEIAPDTIPQNVAWAMKDAPHGVIGVSPQGRWWWVQRPGAKKQTGKDMLDTGENHNDEPWRGE